MYDGSSQHVPLTYKFTGKERDTETLNDDFGARYYSNRFGRWLSADWSNVPVAVPYANLTNPQTLNLYAMVADDPESFADLDGHCPPQNPSCSDVKVTAEVTQQPTMRKNMPVTDPDTGKTVLLTGPAGIVTFTITYKGAPLKNAEITESNELTQTVNGMKTPYDKPVEGQTKSNSKGQFDDLVGSTIPTNGSNRENNVIQTFYNTNTVENKDTQTLTIKLPNNQGTCTATDTRFLTDKGSVGTYLITPTKPAVTVTPPHPTWIPTIP